MIKLDINGLTIETQEAIVERLAAGIRALPGFGVNFKADDAKAMAGQLLLFLAEADAVTQQQWLATYASFDPAGATGRPLDARVGLTGTTRKGATRSTVTGILTFSDTGTAPNGTLIRNAADDELWELIDGPISSTGAEDKDATFAAVNTGPLTAAAGTTWEAVTVVANLDGFTNPTDDANPGRNRETDAELRVRRQRELYAQGQGPLRAIEGAVSQVEGVVYARCYHNPTTQPTDSDGIPFKAFNVVVETNPTTPPSALQQAIWDAIFSAMGAGGEAYGTDYEGSVTDSESQTHEIAFDTVSLVEPVIEVDLVTSGTEDPITPNLATVVKDRILEVAQADLSLHGRDVRRIDIEGIVADMLDAGTISGPYAVNVRMAISPGSPTNVTRLVVGIRERADWNSSNITVNVT